MDYLVARVRNLNIDTRHPATIAFATAGTLTALGLGWVLWDYSAWLSFGTGGTPPNPSGYWRMMKIRWTMFRRGDNLHDYNGMSDEKPAFLKPLPWRDGPRPAIMARTMPQRQVPEQIAEDVREKIHALPKKLREAYPGLLILDKSHTEGGSTDAIHAKEDLPGRDPRAVDRVLKNEIAHVHPADNALHVWLSPADAKEVVKKGWGERFPLSCLGMIHEGLIFVYAPRTLEEVDVIEKIVKAGIEFLTGFGV